jgi:[ribosomal protein S5]-alanine N-acetyltransferase
MSALSRGRAWAATIVEKDLLDEPVMLRPPRVSDVRAREALRSSNESWLRPWDPSLPGGAPEPHSPLEPLVALARKSPARPYIVDAHRDLLARRGIAFGWLICYGTQLAGEVNLRQISWGSVRSAELGYWVDQKLAGRGIMPTALAMCVDHCFGVLGLHRLEAGIRPENVPSRRAVEKLGFHDEGIRRRQVHIDGEWRDHICYAVTTEDVPGGMLPRWRTALAASRSGS